jgi:hypothetical protein
VTTPDPVRIRAVVATSALGVKQDGELRVTDWSDAARASRAWKRLALWWFLALIVVVVPPHVPWVTIAFVGGIVAATLAMRQRAFLHAQTIDCPDCKTAVAIDEQPETWPLGARCKECALVFWIEPRKE